MQHTPNIGIGIHWIPNIFNHFTYNEVKSRKLAIATIEWKYFWSPISNVSSNNFSSKCEIELKPLIEKKGTQINHLWKWEWNEL